jgi:hypothetical protein
MVFRPQSNVFFRNFVAVAASLREDIFSTQSFILACCAGFFEHTDEIGFGCVGLGVRVKKPRFQLIGDES